MQTVSWAGSTYDIPNQRGDTPWSGLSDFAIAVAAKGINTGGGSFTLLADLNFGTTFGLVSTYFKSRTADIATAGILRLASTDTIQWRNNANGGNVSLSKNTSDELLWNGSRIILAGGGLIINADISASAAIAFSKMAALTVSRALVSDGSGIVSVATTTATEIEYVNGVTSAIQTQLDAKVTTGVGVANSLAYYTAASAIAAVTAITASRALASDSNGLPVASATTATELGYVSGVTSAIQTQITAKAADSAVVHNTGTENVAGAKTFTTQLIGKGTATNDSAASGYIGEYIESVVTTGTFGATNVYADATSISLTAGDWDISIIAYANLNGATLTELTLGIGTASGTSGTGVSSGNNAFYYQQASSSTAHPIVVGTVPPWRASISGTTTYYLKILATYSAGSAPVISRARLSARRVR